MITKGEKTLLEGQLIQGKEQYDYVSLCSEKTLEKIGFNEHELGLNINKKRNLTIKQDLTYNATSQNFAINLYIMEKLFDYCVGLRESNQKEFGTNFNLHASQIDGKFGKDYIAYCTFFILEKDLGIGDEIKCDKTGVHGLIGGFDSTGKIIIEIDGIKNCLHPENLTLVNKKSKDTEKVIENTQSLTMEVHNETMSLNDVKEKLKERLIISARDLISVKYKSFFQKYGFEGQKDVRPFLIQLLSTCKSFKKYPKSATLMVIILDMLPILYGDEFIKSEMVQQKLLQVEYDKIKNMDLKEIQNNGKSLDSLAFILNLCRDKSLGPFSRSSGGARNIDISTYMDLQDFIGEQIGK